MTFNPRAFPEFSTGYQNSSGYFQLGISLSLTCSSAFSQWWLLLKDRFPSPTARTIWWNQRVGGRVREWGWGCRGWEDKGGEDGSLLGLLKLTSLLLSSWILVSWKRNIFVVTQIPVLMSDFWRPWRILGGKQFILAVKFSVLTTVETQTDTQTLRTSA